MASEVMTFDSIVSKVRHEIDDNEGGYLNLTGDRVKEVLDELEAAHKREVEKLDNVFHARHLNQMLHTSQSALEVEIVRNKKLEECLSRAINIICGKCYDKVRAKCARGEKKDCEVLELRKALAKE